MTLRTDLIQLANDYGVPGEQVTQITANAKSVTFTYFLLDHRDIPTVETRTRTVALDRSPVRDEGTPIYDALKAEPHRLEQWEVGLIHGPRMQGDDS